MLHKMPVPLSNQYPKLNNKVKVKKNQILTVSHSKQWFINRVGEQIFTRIIKDGEVQRIYMTIQSIAHAESIYVHQNISGKKYYQ